MVLISVVARLDTARHGVMCACTQRHTTVCVHSAPHRVTVCPQSDHDSVSRHTICVSDYHHSLWCFHHCRHTHTVTLYTGTLYTVHTVQVYATHHTAVVLGHLICLFGCLKMSLNLLTISVFLIAVYTCIHSLQF